MNEVLINKDDKILNPNIPRYEKFKKDVNSLFKFKFFSQGVQIGAMAKVSTVMGELKIPSGYTCLGIIPCDNGYGDSWQVTYSKYGNNVVAYIDSYINTTLNSTLQCMAVFVKTDYYNQNLVS